MKTFLLLICFFGFVGLLLYLGSLVVRYDESRKNRSAKPMDRIFDVIRWGLYVPIGVCAGIAFNIAITFLWSSMEGWFLSVSVMQVLLLKVLFFVVTGFCFYVIIPLLNKIKKIQSAAITCLILGSLSFFAMFLDYSDVTKDFVLDIIGIIVCIGLSIYVIVKPEIFE